MSDPDPSEPVSPGGGPRGVGESVDAPGPDLPPVEEAPPGRPPVGESPAQAGPAPATLRRAPRYGPFIGTGVVIGAVIGVVLTIAVPDDGRFSTGAVLGYLAVSLGLLGGLLGGAAAVLVDRRTHPGRDQAR
ncbi:MAG TPA: hypothetical protein VI248_21945 [Kineosporiaceae bacterium]